MKTYRIKLSQGSEEEFTVKADGFVSENNSLTAILYETKDNDNLIHSVFNHILYITEVVSND